MKADDGGAKLKRFNVAHAGCGGVTFIKPTEADIEVVSGRMRVWVSGRCDGCGATIREFQDGQTMVNAFTARVEAAGIKPAIESAPIMLLTCMAAILKAILNETQQPSTDDNS